MMRLVTISASYGAGGSVVAPALAERLGLSFLERVTTSEGHPSEPGPCDEQLTDEEVKATPVHRLLASFTEAMPTGPTLSPPSTHHQDRHLRTHGEAGIHRVLAIGSGVILGRAAAVVLGKNQGFHVRLDGPPALRVAQGAVIRPTRPCITWSSTPPRYRWTPSPSSSWPRSAPRIPRS